ncbi:flagellar protein FlgN [Pseudalkalibacillus caeni]|uniref:Flagellar protein FlgN n=1 Tax=Exobacillus caeni TaxID=2574798 RepID=A0A5R9EZ98_9BACL|nr:flagellar protein FlgN [Pseudalkalibacillus caeni]TLS36622.1 flagellar protein FlgN [Pseudalkalibacillus caeni]
MDSLVSNLQEMIDVHKKWIQTAEEKQEALINRDIDNLTRINIKEKELASTVETLEEKRAAIVEEITKKYNLQPNTTLSQLINAIEEEGRLQFLMDELLECVHNLKAVNQLNAEILKDSMNFISYILDHFTSSTDSNMNYQRPNQRMNQAASARGLFDAKA